MSQDFSDSLHGKLHFDMKQLSFCTHYSWFGVVKNERLGIEELHLFYNRKPALLSPNFLTFRVELPNGGSEKQAARSDLPLRIDEHDARGFSGSIAFIDSDILCYHARLEERSEALSVRATLLLPESEPRLDRELTYDSGARRLKIETRTPRTDERDPDPHHPLTVCMRIPPTFELTGVLADGHAVDAPGDGCRTTTDGPLVLTFAAPAQALKSDEQTFVIGIGEGPTADKIEDRLRAVKAADSATSTAASNDWLARGLDQFSLDGVRRKLRTHYAKAAYQILCNTKAARGQIGRHAVFPSRGNYCAHYLWDACFTNLGVAQFNERLASDFLIALCENQEQDGKIPQFVCATWNRPGDSQPPLIAWAAWRLYERFGNKELLREVYEPLCRMVDWWFEHRDEDRDGVVEYDGPLESGWDDSPRFDKGRIAGVDLNAYLNREMRLLARMAPELARESEASGWEERAAEHARRIHSRLFDPEDRLFYDRLVKEDRLHKVLTPACFAPLWVGVKLAPDLVEDMISRYLLNPKHFFGMRPFPVVAYSDPNYKPDKWWRGPVWPNIAWTMIEVLRVHGLKRECKEATDRLLEMMLASDELNELYSSSSGKPLGSPGLCWGAAVFMALAKEEC